MSRLCPSGIARLARAFFVSTLLPLYALAAAPASSPPDARELLAAVDRALFLEAYQSRATMVTVEPGAEPRSMSLETWSRRDRGSYLEVLAPARVKGTRFLQLDGSLWMFNPKAGSANALRLSSRDSFQGSTLSNADIGKNQFSDDYEPALAPDAVLGHTELGQVPCRVIDAKAKNPDAAYGRVVMWLRASDSMPLRMEYYAKSGLLFKRMELSAIRSFGPITRPSVMRMESLEKKGTVTTLTLEAIEAREVPLSIFNKNHLTR